MRFYSKRDDNYLEERLTVLDTIKVDDHSRLTFTKRIREIFPVRENDIIVVYSDNMDKQNKLVLKIQRNDIIIDAFTLKRDNTLLNKNIEKNYKDTAVNRQHLLSPRKSVISVLLVDDEEDVLLAVETVTSK